ncbi:hypothetical protein AN641_09695 [Candidatus Epulonipiscioides gigas]|nr:hypothetical protein AN641_09695 [Epulopiscium sp. SCG-C07WGA-EpuloA2]
MFLIIFFIQNFIYLKHIVLKIISIKINEHYIYLLSFLNVISSIIWLQLIPISLFWAYLFLSVFYCLEIILCYKGALMNKIAIALTIIIHLLCITSIVNSLLCFITHNTINYIINESILFMITKIVTSLLCIFMMYILIKLIPSKYWPKLVINQDEIKIFVSLEIITVACMLSSSAAYHVDLFVKEHVFQQVILGLSWLIVQYIGIFMLIGFEILRERKINIERTLQLDNIYKNALIEQSDVIIQVDCKTGIILNHISKGIPNAHLIGLSYNQVISDVISNDINVLDREQIKKVSDLNYMLNCFKSGKSQYSFEYRLIETNKTNFEWFKVNVIIKSDITSNKIIALLIINNIQKEKDLILKSEIDELSGLYNKNTTATFIQDYLNKNTDGILFMIDVDNFKSVNDRLGHNIGDRVIEDVGRILRYIFEEHNIIGRMGGDEFVVFIKNYMNESKLETIATRLCRLMNKTYYNNNQHVTISASIGIATVFEGINNFRDIYIMADAAMYRSKQKGKNTFTIYNYSPQLQLISSKSS